MNMQFNPERLTLEVMASGHLCLCLSEKISWKDFPNFAHELLPLIGATVVGRTDGVEMRIWDLKLPHCSLSLVHEDYPPATTLESATDEADAALRELREKLRKNGTMPARQP